MPICEWVPARLAAVRDDDRKDRLRYAEVSHG
jgi:hypothetical protein